MESSVQIAESIDTERKIFYKYYVENDFFVSPEGILKVLATVVCTLSSIAFAWGGWCGAGLVAGGTGLVAGATLAALCALSALLATHAPMTCFITVGHNIIDCDWSVTIACYNSEFHPVRDTSCRRLRVRASCIDKLSLSDW
nr:uncharacterized protein LOC113401042 [Vanessa tameamea]